MWLGSVHSHKLAHQMCTAPSLPIWDMDGAYINAKNLGAPLPFIHSPSIEAHIWSHLGADFISRLGYCKVDMDLKQSEVSEMERKCQAIIPLLGKQWFSKCVYVNTTLLIGPWSTPLFAVPVFNCKLILIDSTLDLPFFSSETTIASVCLSPR